LDFSAHDYVIHGNAVGTERARTHSRYRRPAPKANAKTSSVYLLYTRSHIQFGRPLQVVGRFSGWPPAIGCDRHFRRRFSMDVNGPPDLEIPGPAYNSVEPVHVRSFDTAACVRVSLIASVPFDWGLLCKDTRWRSVPYRQVDDHRPGNRDRGAANKYGFYGRLRTVWTINFGRDFYIASVWPTVTRYSRRRRARSSVLSSSSRRTRLCYNSCACLRTYLPAWLKCTNDVLTVDDVI